MTVATDAFAGSAAALMEAVRAVAADPADQIRLLAPLATFGLDAQGSPAPAAGNPLSAAIAVAVTATSALMRRTALFSLALATAAYQPTSFDDAAALTQQVSALFDAEILLAADAGDDLSYSALREVRAAIVADLAARGANLPHLVTVATPAPLPALALAYRLYGDATRADDLITRADPIHPGFMPTSFLALAS